MEFCFDKCWLYNDFTDKDPRFTSLLVDGLDVWGSRVKPRPSMAFSGVFATQAGSELLLTSNPTCLSDNSPAKSLR
ncbi:hypothetical protein TorRG33x02_230210, partial [Trema orientale]